MYDVAYIAALSNPYPMDRSFVVARVGLNNLPASTAFFSSVDVDTVLRKEPGKKMLANVVFSSKFHNCRYV
jgi:hypothetical protein